MLLNSEEAWSALAMDLQPALRLALAVEHGQMGVVVLRDDRSGVLRPAATEGFPPGASEELARRRLSLESLGAAAASGKRVVVSDAGASGNGYAELASALHFRALDVIPFASVSGSTSGALALMFTNGEVPRGDAASVVDMCARLLAEMLDNMCARQTAERERLAAEEASRLRLQFLAKMCHELRTPLQSVAGYIDLLRIGAVERPSPWQGSILDRIDRSERLLSAVIDDLVLFARIEAAQVEYRISAIVAAEVMRSAETVMSPLAKARGIELVIDPCAKGLKVRADGARLLQVLINLLANAVRFTPDGGRVQLSCDTQVSGHCGFRVTDTGPGIPKEKFDAIFHPYVQLEAPVAGHPGSGLGLAISREFVNGMKGELSVESEMGKGSTFTARFPLHVEALVT